MASEPHVNYNGKTYPLPTSGFKLGEIDQIERYFDCSFDSLRSGQMMLASVWLAIHRVEPDFTWEQAAEMEIESLTDEEEEAVVSGPPDESAPAGEGNGSGIQLDTGVLSTGITSESE